MIGTLLRIAMRFLIGPGGRMLFIVGVVIAAWIWWAWTPLAPLASWTISEYESAMTECSRDASTLITVASSTHRAPYGGIPQSILDGPIRIWDLAAGRERVSIPVSGPPFRFVRLAADGSWLLTVDENWTFKLWDPAAGRFRAVLNPPTGAPANVNSHPWFCLSEDDRLIAVYDSDAVVVRVCEGLTGRLVAKITAHVPHSRSRRTVTNYWPRFPSLAPSPAYGTSAPAGRYSHYPVTDNRSCAVAISPNGRLLATGLYPRLPNGSSPGSPEVKLWNAATGQLLAEIEVGGSRNFVHTLAFSPDSSLLIVRGWGTSLVWDVTEMPPRNRDDLIAATFSVGKDAPFLDSNHGPRLRRINYVRT